METIIRASLVYFFLWGVTRSIGKRELSEMNPFDLVLLIVMGDLVQQGVTTEDMSVTGAFLAVGTMACWVMTFSYVAWKWPRARPALEGLSVVIVRDGALLDDALALERLPADEVLQAARLEGIEDLAQVRYAILEPGGNITFLRADAESEQVLKPDREAGT